jgi:prolyl oligopeptidase
MIPPATRTGEHLDDYFGTEVPDPYRWLEGPTSDPEVAAWAAAQADFARRYLQGLPGRAAIAASLDALTGLAVESAPTRTLSSWFRFTNDGTAEQLVYRVSDTPLGTGKVLIDPNPLSAGSTTSIAAASASPDGRLVAYSYSEAGSDWHTWRVRDVETGLDLDDTVPWAKFTDACWLPDSSGFLYGGFAEPSAGQDGSLVEAVTGHQLRLHRLGAEAHTDEVVFALPDEPEVLFDPTISDDDRWLVISAERGTDPTNRIWIADLGHQPLRPRPLIDADDAAWRPVTAAGGSVVFRTDSDAPCGRLVAVAVDTGAVTELIAERTDILNDARGAGGRLVVHWLTDAHSAVTVHDAAGAQISTIPLPGIGSVLELTGTPDSDVLHLSYTSFTEPRIVLEHDLGTGVTSEVFSSLARATATVAVSGLHGVVVEQPRYLSSDGTTIPMFLIHKEDLDPSNGPHPALLYGYGGFRIPVLPAFNPSRAAFVAAGGVLAIPSLRGGGEFGARWHDAGRLQHKQTVFDDAIAAAEHLVATGWTSTERLACTGASNGGLLAGALLTQRPDLFAAVVPEVGVLDMLRFTRFTIGWAWTSDYGNPSASEREFAIAHAYSPLHRLTEGRAYPPTLVMTSDHDDRVVPAHSYKFAARLQAVSGPGAIALLRVELDGGHGAGRARSAIVAERTDALAFISRHVGLSWPDLS